MTGYSFRQWLFLALFTFACWVFVGVWDGSAYWCGGLLSACWTVSLLGAARGYVEGS